MDWGHLIAALVGAVALAVLRPLLWPLKHFLWDKWWSDFVNHGSKQTNIGGKWQVMHVGEPSDGEVLEAKWAVNVIIEQTASEVSGKANAICTAGTATGKNVQYLAHGKFVSNILEITFQDEDRSGRNKSSFLLQVVGDGSNLEGYRLFLGRNKNDIRSIQCKWVRNNTSASGCGTA